VEYGQLDLAYAAACKLDVPLAEEKGVRIMFMRHIELGRRFFALSLSFRNFKTNQPMAFEHPFARKVAPVFFGRRVADTLVTAPLHARGPQVADLVLATLRRRPVAAARSQAAHHAGGRGDAVHVGRVLPEGISMSAKVTTSRSAC
jgi:hypothetical protein